MLKSHKLSYVEVAEFVELTVEEVKALDTDEAVIEIKGILILYRYRLYNTDIEIQILS